MLDSRDESARRRVPDLELEYVQHSSPRKECQNPLEVVHLCLISQNCRRHLDGRGFSHRDQ